MYTPEATLSTYMHMPRYSPSAVLLPCLWNLAHCHHHFVACDSSQESPSTAVLLQSLQVCKSIQASNSGRNLVEISTDRAMMCCLDVELELKLELLYASPTNSHTPVLVSPPLIFFFRFLPAFVSGCKPFSEPWQTRVRECGVSRPKAQHVGGNLCHPLLSC